jgi:hypothetical protein
MDVSGDHVTALSTFASCWSSRSGASRPLRPGESTQMFVVVTSYSRRVGMYIARQAKIGFTLGSWYSRAHAKVELGHEIC